MRHNPCMPPQQRRRIAGPKSAPAPIRPRRRATPAASPGGTLSTLPAHEIEVQWLPLEAITASQRNPRRKLDRIDELAASLDAHGLLQPVLVRPVDNHYELVAGHRRFQA